MNRNNIISIVIIALIGFTVYWTENENALWALLIFIKVDFD